MKFAQHDRVTHARYGDGTVLEAGEQAVVVEFDDGTERRLLVGMSPLRLQGEPAPPAAPAEPPRETCAAPPSPAPPPKNDLMPKPERDPLLDQITAAIAARGPGASDSLALAVGLKRGSHRNWRHCGRIPPEKRFAVLQWLRTPAAQAVTPATPAATPAKPKAAPAPKEAAVIPREPPRPAQATRITREMCETFFAGLGLVLADAWVPEGETMRKVRVAVLP